MKKFRISESEKEIIKRFKTMKYPAIYKMDTTDNILFVEMVDFDVCSLILHGKRINKTQYDGIINEYEKYLTQVNVKLFDEYALNHYNDIINIMEIFKKYYKPSAFNNW